MSSYNPEAFEKNNAFLKDDGIYFLQKPYSSHTLLQMVRECLDKKVAHAA